MTPTAPPRAPPPRPGAPRPAAPVAPPRSAFKQAEARRELQPPHVIPIPVTAWSSAYVAGKKTQDKIGLRRIAEKDLLSAMADAEKRAWQYVPEPGAEDARVEQYNRELSALIVARGTCRADNVAEPFFRGADDEVLIALTSEGIVWLFEQINVFAIETSPTIEEADDDGLAWLAAALHDGKVWNGLRAAEVQKLRRLLGHVIARLRPAEP